MAPRMSSKQLVLSSQHTDTSQSSSYSDILLDKQVSFGDDSTVTVEVHEFERVPAEIATEIWYNKQELNDLTAAEVQAMKVCAHEACKSNQDGIKSTKSKSKKSTTSNNDCEDHTSRGLESNWNLKTPSKHVRHVVKMYNLQLQDAMRKQQQWDPENIRRVSLHSSKPNLEAALQMARQDFIDVGGKPPKDCKICKSVRRMARSLSPVRRKKSNESSSNKGTKKNGNKVGVPASAAYNSKLTSSAPVGGTTKNSKINSPVRDTSPIRPIVTGTTSTEIGRGRNLSTISV